jgi:GNAT superfamily N-acetyltransferase
MSSHMRPAFDIVEIRSAKGDLCRRLLKSLPEWFGIPEAIENYSTEVEFLPVLAAVNDGIEIGFIALKFQTAVAADAYVLGVAKEWHRRGVGKALFAAAEKLSLARGAKFMTVKTIASSHPDPNYARTRLFYEAIGFEPLEVFPSLWGSHNPCLMMLKLLDPSRLLPAQTLSRGQGGLIPA